MPYLHRHLAACRLAMTILAAGFVGGCSLLRLGEAGPEEPRPAGTAVTPPAESRPAPSRIERPATAPAVTAPLPKPAPPPPPPPNPLQIAYQEGMQAWQTGDLLKARALLNQVLQASDDPEQNIGLRGILSQIADETVFSPEVLADDPLTEEYRITRGDSLLKIARRFRVTPELLSEINRLTDKHTLRPGRRLKIVKGPFSATVVKRTHEMHLYLQGVYLRTCRVALGTDNKTPTGKWKVTTRLKNPSWTDPQTGRRYAPGSDDNPIGKFWIALEGTEGNAVGQTGYGIHGTNDEASIGTDASMGCVRLGDEDIRFVYSLLVFGSKVEIVE